MDSNTSAPHRRAGARAAEFCSPWEGARAAKFCSHSENLKKSLHFGQSGAQAAQGRPGTVQGPPGTAQGRPGNAQGLALRPPRDAQVRPGTPRDGPGTPRDRPGTAWGPSRDRRGACPRPPQRSCPVQELSWTLPGAAPGRPSAPRAAPALPELARSCPGPASMPAQSSQELPRAPQKLSKT